MGQESPATCGKCGNLFRVRQGGGFVFHLLHCDTCGEEKVVLFEELGEIHLRYLKGLPGPYSISTQEHDRHVRENYPGEPLLEEEYYREVEKLAGECPCGGHFTMKARPRCPKCHSSKWTQDKWGTFTDYD